MARQKAADILRLKAEGKSADFDSTGESCARRVGNFLCSRRRAIAEALQVSRSSVFRILRDA